MPNILGLNISEFTYFFDDNIPMHTNGFCIGMLGRSRGVEKIKINRKIPAKVAPGRGNIHEFSEKKIMALASVEAEIWGSQCSILPQIGAIHYRYGKNM
jgi:hypothetical protein